jgi:hypothetical protein
LVIAIKPTFIFFISLETTIKRLFIFIYLEKLKAKNRFNVLRKLYYTKAVAYRKTTSSSTRLVDFFVFGSRSILQKLNQTGQTVNIHFWKYKKLSE